MGQRRLPAVINAHNPSELPNEGVQMYLHIDPTQVPPIVEVREPDDFKSFKVVIEASEHAWIAPDVLTELAGRGDDEQWRQHLTGMLEFAASKGWCDDAGRVRAHVEMRTGTV
ncbi:hypothetical protein BOO86_25395 [Mycobacterium sp. CBMA 234]|nr:hypothetical protein [Mycolicibacterium sp. CBMA 234]